MEKEFAGLAPVKATPGPWRIDIGERDGMDRFVVRCARDKEGLPKADFGIATVWQQSGGEPLGPEDEANARLIAAAPALLEALLATHQALGYRVANDAYSWAELRAFEMAWAAIALASGEASPTLPGGV